MVKKSEKYEDILEKLKDIVNLMEENQLSIDEAMKKYEEGVKLCNKLYSMLNGYEEKIMILKDNKEEVFKVE